MSAGIHNIRRGAQKAQDSRKGGGKGGFYLKWKPPQKPANSPYPVAEPVVFIDAAYQDPWNPDPATGQPGLQPGYHFQEHNFRLGPKDFRSCICSAGHDPHAAQPCVGCASSVGRKGTEARDQWAFNLAHLVNYHMIPWVKEVNGQQQTQMKEDGSGPVRIREQCKGRGCEYCQRQEPFGFGAHRILTVGSGHLQTILAMNDKVGMYCVNCMSIISLLQFSCEHCHQTILDVATSGYDNQQLADFARSNIRCQYCGQHGTPKEVIDCGYDPRGVTKIQATCQVADPATGAAVPGTRRFSIFDCVFYLQREGEKKDTKIVDISWQPKWQFATADGRTLDDTLKDIAPSPLDMPEIFRPLSLQDQANKLGVQNPFVSNGPQYGGYGGQQQAPQYGGQQPQQQSPYGQIPQQGYQQPQQNPQYQQGYPNQQMGQPYPQQAPQQQPQYQPPQQQNPYPQQQPQYQPQQPQAQPQFGQQPHPQGNVPGTGRPPYGR